MTVVGGFKAATQRKDALGVHSIGAFALTVPKIEQAEHFYGSFGLELRAEGNHLALRTAGNDPQWGGYRWGRVTAGVRKAIHHIAFHCFEEDLPRFKAHVEAQGVRLLDPPADFASNGLWFHDHDGTLVEIRVGPKTSPDAKPTVEMVDQAAGIGRAPDRSRMPTVRPRRLAHILRFTTSVERAVEFYGRVLGLRLSDRSDDIVAFMHGVHGSDHHLMAFVKSSAPGLHHLSWDMPSVETVGLGAMNMADKGYRKGWGLGRHVLGSNYFHYVRDPWGSFCEYSCDIDYIPVTMDWQAGNHPAEDSLYLWGPEMPPEFVVNTEAEDWAAKIETPEATHG